MRTGFILLVAESTFTVTIRIRVSNAFQVAALRGMHGFFFGFVFCVFIACRTRFELLSSVNARISRLFFFLLDRKSVV